MNDDEFLKEVLKYGKIRPVEDAFKKFPVEEEIHKGKIDNYIGVAEEYEEYNINFKYKVGDIVFVKRYKYEDGTEGRNHLFVIINQNNNIAVPIEYLGMIISSKIEKVKYQSNILLPKDNKNNLETDSIVKTDVLYTIESKEIVMKIGKIDGDKIEEYKETYLKIIKNNKYNKKTWFFYKNIVKYLMLITLYLATRVTPTLVQFKAYENFIGGV